jgi:hypothetical protein
MSWRRLLSTHEDAMIFDLILLVIIIHLGSGFPQFFLVYYLFSTHDVRNIKIFLTIILKGIRIDSSKTILFSDMRHLKRPIEIHVLLC